MIDLLWVGSSVFTFISRATLCLGYAWLSVMIWRKLPLTAPRRKPSRIFLMFVCLTWALWYGVLAMFDIPLDPWSVLSRALHVPLVLAIGMNVWVATTEEHR